jgi:glycosyltransferase involved in cell wall biosynthesis
VHAHSVSALSFVVGVLAKLFFIPTVIKFAGDWAWETMSTGGVKAKDFDELRERSFTARFLWRVERFGLSLFDYIWAPSEFRAQNVEDVQGHRKNVRIIYNALDLPAGGYHDMKEGDPLVIISANRFIPHKRMPMMVRAFAAFKNPSSKLVLIGTGQEAEIEATRAEAVFQGVESQVEFTGRIESSEIYERFAKASVYVSTSLEEGFPNVFVEAMHFGLPIVSTDVGGCHEIVREGETGYLYDPLDEALLVERLKTLMNNTVLRNNMGRAAYEKSHQYELGTVIEQFMSLYTEAISRK